MSTPARSDALVIFGATGGRDSGGEDRSASDTYPELLPPNESGKTEAWVVVRAGRRSRIYAGLKSGTTATVLQHAIRDPTDLLAGFKPAAGDTALARAGTVHSLGNDVVLFEP